jgi:hypothetical protein
VSGIQAILAAIFLFYHSKTGQLVRFSGHGLNTDPAFGWVTFGFSDSSSA